MIIRLAAFHKTLHLGEFPVRYLYSLNHGFGYPVLDFLYPLPFYLGEIIHSVGFNFTNSVKILFALSFLLSAGSMYLLVSRKWGKFPGIIAALFYTYAPYRIFDVYHRGSLGEATAFIFVPLVFYFLDTNLILAAIAYAALICSHNTIALLFTPLIILAGYKKPLFILLSLSLSAFFWFPALYDLQYTRAGVIQVADFTQYFLTSQNFLSLVGPLTPLALLLAITNLPLVAMTLISLYLSSPYSALIWQHSPLPQLVQFPWRFLSITVFTSAILLGFVVHKINRLLFTIPLAIIIILLSLPAITVIPLDKPDDYYSTNDATTTVKNEYMPIWVKTDPAIATDQKYIYLNPTTIRVNLVYFPGLKVYVNNKEVAFNYERSGLPEITVIPGSHQVTTKFQETPERLAADFISLFALVLLILLAKRPH